MPQFTLLVPVYNHEPYIGAALDSILAQTRDDWEAVVVDDGSTDGTSGIIDAYAARDPRIRVIHKSNGGVSTALNAGLRQARGEWVLWLSSDDLFEPHKLATHASWIDSHRSTELFFTQFRFLHDADGSLGEAQDYRNIPPIEIQVVEMMRCILVNGITICARKQAVEQVGGFNEEMRYAQDYDLWLRLMLRQPAVHIPMCTCRTRVHPGQVGALFNDACFFETAASCLDVLGLSTMPELFPALDLGDPGSAATAARALLNVALSPRSALYAMGQHAALLLILVEWVEQRQSELPVPIVQSIVQRLLVGARSQADAPLGRLCAACVGRLWGRSVAISSISAEDLFAEAVVHRVELAEGLELGALAAYGARRGWKSEMTFTREAPLEVVWLVSLCIKLPAVGHLVQRFRGRR